MSELGVIVVAAGIGSRMGTPESKQYLVLNDKPILVHTLERFQEMELVDAIVLVVGEGDISRCQAYMDQYGLSKVTAVVAGGADRQASVFKGIQALPEGTRWVAVHDGVRPFIGEARFRSCLTEARITGAAVLAVPVKDTIKVADATGVIQSTPDRRSLWAIQTPQAFRLDLLREAHERAIRELYTGTDDSVLVERLGVHVRIAEGTYTNIKITTPDDLLWAETISTRYGREGIQ
ncbi:MAG: 2-C-methyl-D-erythritol 4-phosphate cytidylyltransferase [Paenibacillus sp.]|nr:2-C-methyl-D-erythritol 4-phosphate cytidylyltransferase [Paenibacillus sp.]